MKKSIGFIAFFALFVISLSFASALTPSQVGEQIKDFYIDLFEPILAALFGGWELGGLFLFEKFLIFILLVAVIFVIVKKIDIFKENGFVLWSISIIIPLIGVRFLNIEQINTIIFAYKWVAVGLTTILPLLIFFFFVYNLGGDHPILRKLLWVILLGVYVGIYSSIEIDESIYLWTIIAIIVMLLLDRKINNYFNLLKIKKADRNWKFTAVAKIDEDIRLIMASGLPTEEKAKLKKDKEKQKKDLLKDSF